MSYVTLPSVRVACSSHRPALTLARCSVAAHCASLRVLATPALRASDCAPPGHGFASQPRAVGRIFPYRHLAHLWRILDIALNRLDIAIFVFVQAAFENPRQEHLMRKEPLARRVVSRLRFGEFQVFRHFCLVFQRASPPFRLYTYCTIFPALLQAFFADTFQSSLAAVAAVMMISPNISSCAACARFSRKSSSNPRNTLITSTRSGRAENSSLKRTGPRRKRD